MAVIGSGPAGFYTAYRVMSKVEGSLVDMYEGLPVPFGLVRYGVAPDHPEVKNCQDKFSEVALSPRFNFVGNVSVGSDIPLSLLKPHYDAIVLAYGASKDRRLNIPGESSLRGIYSARDFVGWYNGLPEHAGLNPDLGTGEEAVVIGQGNVALDVARILLTDTDVLRKTDITDYAIQALVKSKIKRVRVVGRRGPLQASFTIREVRELMNLPYVGFTPIDPSLMPPDPRLLPRASKRLTQILAKGSATSASSARKSWELDFLHSPIAFQSSSPDSDQLSSIKFEKTALVGPDPFDPSAQIRGTSQSIELPASLAFRSIGYKSEPLPGLSELNVPFDERLGLIPNDRHGRVINPNAGPGVQTAGHVPGMYCAGWVKRGPTGVIASTMDDAFATGDIIAQDWHGNVPFSNGTQVTSTSSGWEGARLELDRRGVAYKGWADWEQIDAAERARGKEIGKEREKFSTLQDMLDVLKVHDQ
ncbi:MAG: NADPH-adrenodoxin reductase [Sclerophora amabilis]|nr:MAG: NADPH-adrenodoxin reductase [Sclerophora amabilis]